jgi:hypothetical protein
MTNRHGEVDLVSKPIRPKPYTPGHRNYLLPLDQPAHELRPLMKSWTRRLVVLAALSLVIYGFHGLLVDDIYIPGKRSPGHHYRGAPAFVALPMIISFASVLITVAFARYDPRQNTLVAGRFAKFLLTVSVISILGGIAMFLSH